MLWWLKMSNASARNSRATRSVTAKDLPRAKSPFHAPGPLKAFRRVMLDGKGPNVSMHPNHAVLHVSSGAGSVRRLNSLGFFVGAEVFTEKLVIVPLGVYRGIPEGTPLFAPSVLAMSTMEKGTPERTLNTGMALHPPNTCRSHPRLPLKNGSCQIALSTIRCRMS